MIEPFVSLLLAFWGMVLLLLKKLLFILIIFPYTLIAGLARIFYKKLVKTEKKIKKALRHSSSKS